MEAKDPIGEQLKKLRKERKVSVPSLADILIIPKDRIYKWEQGSSPKYQDRQILDKWIKDGTWKNVPHGTPMEDDFSLKDEGGDPIYSDLKSKTIYNLSVSNRSISKAHEELVEMTKVQRNSDDRKILDQTSLMVNALYEVFAELLLELKDQPLEETRKKLGNKVKELKIRHQKKDSVA